MTDPQDAYLQLLARVDDFTRRVSQRYPGMLQCQAGCDDCCRRDLSLFPIEIDRVLEQLAGLAPDQQRLVLDRARAALVDEEAACPLLEEGLCLVYPVRPVICRSHGLPLLIPEQDSLSICPHNFKGLLDIEGECVLDLTPVNQILATTNLLRSRAQEKSPERISISRAIVEALVGGESP